MPTWISELDPCGRTQRVVSILAAVGIAAGTEHLETNLTVTGPRTSCSVCRC